MIENSLNQNEGISAAVDFQNSSAAIIYDSELFSKTEIVEMINGYRGGKFTASLSGSNNKSDQSSNCSKGKIVVKKLARKMHHVAIMTPKNRLVFLKEKKNENALSGMIPGHNGCTKSYVVQVKIIIKLTA